MPRTVGKVLAAAAIAAACAGGQSAQKPSAASSAHAPARAATPAERLQQGLARLERSDYAAAEADLRAALVLPDKDRALLGLSELLLQTGRYQEAATTARGVSQAAPARARAAFLEAEALRRQGQLDRAESVLRAVQKLPEARRARLLLGEILLERGQRKLAEPVLMTLIEDYNADRIDQNDGLGLAMVGRAAHLLRSPQDANDAFNEAERATSDIETLLWRAELFLDKYDPGHAAEVTLEVLERAPNHPEANVWLAFVKLAEALDFDEAERLANKALAVNPKLASAHFVLAGIALRDMEIELAERRIKAGLVHNPRDLELLSLHATARFLADDAAGLAAAKRAVLELNPEYTRLYQILGEYADWEHRYDELVGMMREAVRIDADDAKALAQLGLNLIRSGNDSDGVSALQSSFDKDPFNVRVFNTLNLYEKIIPKDYVEVAQTPFKIRYHKDERAILERYVPDLLRRAWQKMVVEYGYTPETPVGIELYAERQNFAVRTSGLPQTAIQGVCFGRTLAAMSPRDEQFNLGMTLWHELAHVFHIQSSKSHVPRWFTEGYAEYETLVERPEWAREHDPDLYEALRTGHLPKVGAMSRAFTRAEELNDIATAYYASSQILIMLGERYGRAKLGDMLRLWGEGKTTPQVVSQALGVSPDELDRQFREFLDRRLARYKTQFVPRTRVGALAKVRELVKAAPKDASKLTDLAIATARAGAGSTAEKIVAEALSYDPKLPDARFLSARRALARRDTARAGALLKSLVGDGHDGYAVQLLLAQVAEAEQDFGAVKQALTAARNFDPTQSEPIHKLALLAARNGDADGELAELRLLARLEQHDPGVYRRLLELLNERKLYAEARAVGEAAIHADVEGIETHVAFAEALAGDKIYDRALFELESALLCRGTDEQKAEAHARLSELLLTLKRRAEAAKHFKAAQRLDPKNARLGQLPFK